MHLCWADCVGAHSCPADKLESANVPICNVQRQANIARNKAMMAQLELQSLASDLQHSSLQSSPVQQPAPRPSRCA